MKRIKLIVTVLFVFLLSGCTLNNLTSSINSTVDNNKDKLIVHYIDVGQGDATFIEFPNNETMLIDAGEKEYEEKVLNYIKDLNYQRIDYLIGTHPHSDHIGGLKYIVDNLDIGNVYLPKVSSTTKTYTNLLKSIKDKNLKINNTKSGDVIIDDDNLKADVLAPSDDDYSNLNNYSIVLRIVYEDRSFLFMGDAEEESESKILDSYNVKSDVLKVAHHGSNTSSSSFFLNKVRPTYAIISVGIDNSYNHPSISTLDKLNNIGSKIYRTDELGSIKVISDGYGIDVMDSNGSIDINNEFTSNTLEQTNNSNSIELINFNNKLKIGEEKAINIKGMPNTVYDIDVYYSSGISKASGLEDKMSDDNGLVSWTFKVSKNVKVGKYKINITDGVNTLTVDYEIVE